MKKCVKCGFQLEDDALFCAGCGTKQPESGAGNNTSVQTEDIRDPGDMASGHDPHRNPYVVHGHGPDRRPDMLPKPDTRRNADTAGRRVQDAASARTAVEKRQQDPVREAKRGKGKNPHPVLSVFLIILFFLCLNLGLFSFYIRYTFSTEHLEEVIFETDISEIEIGGFVRSMLITFEDQLDDSEYNDLVDVMDTLFDEVYEDTTLGELMRQEMFDALNSYGSDTKSRAKALNSQSFKGELANIITKYTSDIFFDSGKGKIDTDDITELEYAFYSAYYKEELKRVRDEGSVTDQQYELYLERLSGESDEMRRQIRKSLESFPGFDDGSLKELSVRKLFKDQPLWIVRVLASAVFGVGMVVLGIVFLTLSYLVNRKGVKRALIKTGIVLAVEMVLIALFLIGVKITESLITSGSARAMGDLMIDLMRE